jgi:hypothetical protein
MRTTLQLIADAAAGMPAFDKVAYNDGRCYGMKKADLKSPMADPPATFQPRESSSSPMS